LLVTSTVTQDIDQEIYTQNSATALLKESVTFSPTDRLIIKLFVNPVGMTGGEFAFQFGGSSPVITNLFVPHKALPASGNNITLNTANFNGILDSSLFTLQSALDKIDYITGFDIAYNNSTTGLVGNSTQEAIDSLFTLMFPTIAEQGFDGGEPSTTEYLLILDGGDPLQTEITQTVDGGSPSN